MLVAWDENAQCVYISFASLTCNVRQHCVHACMCMQQCRKGDTNFVYTYVWLCWFAFGLIGENEHCYRKWNEFHKSDDRWWPTMGCCVPEMSRPKLICAIHTACCGSILKLHIYCFTLFFSTQHRKHDTEIHCAHSQAQRHISKYSLAPFSFSFIVCHRFSIGPR